MKTYFKNLEEAKAKIELSKLEKVELGLVDDLQKDLQKLEKVLDEAKKQGKQGEKLRLEIVGLVKKLDKLFNQNKTTRKEGTALARKLGVTREKLLKGAKELGFENEIKNNPYYKRSLDVVDNLDRIESQVDKIDITFISQ